jgi:hypothetical protein
MQNTKHRKAKKKKACGPLLQLFTHRHWRGDDVVLQYPSHQQVELPEIETPKAKTSVEHSNTLK